MKRVLTVGLTYTGDKIDGRTAKAMGLVHDAVPKAKLDETVEALAGRIAGVPNMSRNSTESITGFCAS